MVGIVEAASMFGQPLEQIRLLILGTTVAAAYRPRGLDRGGLIHWVRSPNVAQVLLAGQSQGAFTASEHLPGRGRADALRTLGDLGAARSRPSTRPRRATRGDVCTGSPTLATILAGQGDADAAASVAGQMLDYAAGMESCRIDERILKVRDAVVAAGDGQAARELSERVWDMAGVPMRLRR
jgi:hypothetical protein